MSSRVVSRLFLGLETPIPSDATANLKIAAIFGSCKCFDLGIPPRERMTTDISKQSRGIAKEYANIL